MNTWRVLRFIRGMRSGLAGSKYCERRACQKWQASFALMTIGKMRSRGVCKINPLTIAVTVVEDICDTLTEKISDL